VPFSTGVCPLLHQHPFGEALVAIGTKPVLSRQSRSREEDIDIVRRL
jgi:hypothetical protein